MQYYHPYIHHFIVFVPPKTIKNNTKKLHFTKRNTREKIRTSYDRLTRQTPIYCCTNIPIKKEGNLQGRWGINFVLMCSEIFPTRRHRGTVGDGGESTVSAGSELSFEPVSPRRRPRTVVSLPRAWPSITTPVKKYMLFQIQCLIKDSRVCLNFLSRVVLVNCLFFFSNNFSWTGRGLIVCDTIYIVYFNVLFCNWLFLFSWLRFCFGVPVWIQNKKGKLRISQYQVCFFFLSCNL